MWQSGAVEVYFGGRISWFSLLTSNDLGVGSKGETMLRMSPDLGPEKLFGEMVYHS